MSIREGEEFEEIEGGNEDWMSVRKPNGEIGLVPRNYVEPVVTGGFKVRALYPYDATDKMFLSIAENEIIEVFKEKDGWYLGQNEQGKTGYFPVSYVEKL